MEAISSEEATRRWEFLVGIENLKPANALETRKRKRPLSALFSDHSSKDEMSSSFSDSVDDPFDCSSMTIRSTQDLVENTIQEYLEEWKKLEDRKIVKKLPVLREDANTGSEAAIPNTEGSITKKQGTNYGGGWRASEDRLTLPDGFEYNRRIRDQEGVNNDTPVSEEYQGAVVISLKNPTQRLSYRSELSKLFDSIPCCRTLEEETRHGHRVDNTLRLYDETHDPANIPDTYVLARLRVPDRHGLPQSLKSGRESNMRGTELGNQGHLYSTVLLEFWRKLPNRSISSGCHRMVVEFLASQSLWDVHLIISQMAEDELWEAAYDDKALQSDNNISEKVDDALHNKSYSDQNLSGCFFIENTFYKTGSVDYTKPIIDWIEGSDSNNANAIRKTFLGMNASNSFKDAKEMKSTKLGQVVFRPNVRYYHSCHGDVETTVMLVDRKQIRGKRQSNIKASPPYPLLHDIWTAPRNPAIPICDACQIYQAVFKTSADCKATDGGPHSLCQECCQDLNLLQNERNSVKLYRKWQDQATLSNRVVPDKA